jgi:hypothetical protein
MERILCGLVGNEWTNIACSFLDDTDIDYIVLDTFEYSRLEDGTEDKPRVSDGNVYIGRIPTLCVFTGSKRYWFTGIEAIKKYCESIVRASS